MFPNEAGFGGVVTLYNIVYPFVLVTLKAISPVAPPLHKTSVVVIVNSGAGIASIVTVVCAVQLLLSVTVKIYVPPVVITKLGTVYKSESPLI